MKKYLKFFLLLFVLVSLIFVNSFTLKADNDEITISDDITDFSSLTDEQLTKKKITFTGKILTNDLSKLQQKTYGLGSKTATFIIDTNNEGYAFKILPAYNIGTGFAQFGNINNPTQHSIYKDYKWKAFTKYVYDNTNKLVNIVHDVKDANGDYLLKSNAAKIYNGSASDDSTFSISYNKNTEFEVNTSKQKYLESYIEYLSVIHSRTSDVEGKDGSGYDINFSYKYNIYPTFFSSVALKTQAKINGAFKIVKVDSSNNPIKSNSAKFKVYKDENCLTPATYIDGITPIPELSTDANGEVYVNNVSGGDYWVKETVAPSGYELDPNPKKVTVNVPESVEIALDTNSGETNTATINLDTVKFATKWDGNVRTSVPTMEYSGNATDYEKNINASDYQDGNTSAVFIKDGGKDITFTNPTAAELTAVNKVSGGKFVVTLGSMTKEFESPKEVIDYVNDCIDDGTIDEQKDHFKITCPDDLVFYTAQNSQDIPTVTFTNASKPVKLSLVFDKKLKNGQIKGEDFEFVFANLTKVEAPITVKNDAEGNIKFPTIEITEVGTYEYSVSEVKGNDSSIEYDETARNIKIEVSESAWKGLVAIISVNGDPKGTIYSSDVAQAEAGYVEINIDTFKNYKYQPVIFALDFDKKLKDGELHANDFEFAVAEVQPDGSAVIKEISKNDSDGNINFSPLAFDKEGTYEYDVFEITGDDDSIIYDKNVKNLKIIVEKDSTRKCLKASIFVDDVGKQVLYADETTNNDGTINPAYHVELNLYTFNNQKKVPPKPVPPTFTR